MHALSTPFQLQFYMLHRNKNSDLTWALITAGNGGITENMGYLIVSGSERCTKNLRSRSSKVIISFPLYYNEDVQIQFETILNCS